MGFHGATRVVVLRYAQAAKPEQAQPEAQAQQTLGFSFMGFHGATQVVV